MHLASVLNCLHTLIHVFNEPSKLIYSIFTERENIAITLAWSSLLLINHRHCSHISSYSLITIASCRDLSNPFAALSWQNPLSSDWFQGYPFTDPNAHNMMMITKKIYKERYYNAFPFQIKVIQWCAYVCGSNFFKPVQFRQVQKFDQIKLDCLSPGLKKTTRPQEITLTLIFKL